MIIGLILYHIKYDPFAKTLADTLAGIYRKKGTKIIWIPTRMLAIRIRAK